MRSVVVWCGVVVALGAAWAVAGGQPESARPVSAVESLAAEAAALRPLVESDLARAFLDGAAALPEIEPRTLYRDKARTSAYTEAEAAALPEAERAALDKRDYDGRFYYYTGYGSPLVYARPLDILANAGLDNVEGKKILDFGYGTIGHLRLLAALGAEAHGVEVEPVLRALYAPDEGPIGQRGGTITLHHGRWPGDLAAETGKGYDAFISKNTLKLGYIHPRAEADPRTLVHLGVSDEEFVRAVHDALKPGGLFLIYNLCPPQAAEGEKYIPWADGQSPFDRALLERTGFEVLEFDTTDDEAIRPYWSALKYDADGKPVFTWYTLARKRC